MPNNLIFFDSDIDIEYQYQELNYSSNYFETGIKKQSTANSQFEIKYVTENQNIKKEFTMIILEMSHLQGLNILQDKVLPLQRVIAFYRWIQTTNLVIIHF